jgi:small subunit ribosomal protein S18
MADETTNAAPEQQSTPAPSTSSSAPSGPRGPRPAGAPRPAGGPGGGPGGRKFFRRKKVCKFCTEKIDSISYRDVRLLQGFIAERGNQAVA